MNPMKDDPGSSATRQTLASLIGWGLALIAQNNGVPITETQVAGVAVALAGALGYAWRRWVMPLAL